MPVVWSNHSNVVAVQFDLAFDPTAHLIITEIAGGTALRGHVVDSQPVAPGVRRVLIYSKSNAALAEGVLANIQIAITTNAVEGVRRLALTNAILAQANARRATQLNLADGSLTVLSAMRARFQAIKRFADGHIELKLAGPEGKSYVIEGSTNLVSWVPISTNIISGGQVTVADQTAPDFPRRFYRAAQAP
jgi:hypothetical protein